MRSSAFLPKTPSMEAALIGLMLVLFSFIFQADAHANAIRHCVTPDGNLRIFVKNDHGTGFDLDEEGTIIIRNDVTGVTSTENPDGFIVNFDLIPYLRKPLPGCPEGFFPPVASNCHYYGTVYADYMYFDLPFSCDDAMNISYTIIGGGDHILEAECDRIYPVTIKPTSYQEICAKEECIDVTVQIKTDLYPEETSWKIKDADGNVVMRKKEFEDSLSLHKNTKCLPKTETCQGTDYTFTIYDSEGNGLCCGETGDGYYNVLVDGVEVATGGNDFNYEKSISLCGSPPSCVDIEKRKICKETDGCFWKSNNRGGGFCRQCSSLTRKSQCLKQGCPCEV